MSDPENSRLGRWSRRKLEARQQGDAEKHAPEEPPAAGVAPEAAPDMADPDLIAALPSLDDITAGFDITPFLGKGIPTHLKNAALRRLWSASPAVRDYMDPAVDYAWDWNAPGGVPGGGGLLNEHSVAKMIKDLIGAKSEDVGDDISAAAAPPDVAPPDVAPVAMAEGAETVKDAPVAVRPPDRQRADTSAPDDADTPPKPDQTALSSKRRHGGAMPT